MCLKLKNCAQSVAEKSITLVFYIERASLDREQPIPQLPLTNPSSATRSEIERLEPQITPENPTENHVETGIRRTNTYSELHIQREHGFYGPAGMIMATYHVNIKCLDLGTNHIR